MDIPTKPLSNNEKETEKEQNFTSKDILQEYKPVSIEEKHILSQKKMNTHDKPKKISKTRCFICRKKVGLMPFTCKCSDHVFCCNHKLPELHNCTFDFKTDGLQKLSEKLVKIEHCKVIKI